MSHASFDRDELPTSGELAGHVHPLVDRNTPIPTPVLQLLAAVRTAEQTAKGSQRRIAQRLTREVIGGVLEAGYSTRLVAEALGVSVDSVKGRAERSRWTPLAALATVANIEASTVTQWRTPGLLPYHQIGPDDSVLVPTVDVIRILSTPPPRS